MQFLTLSMSFPSSALVILLLQVMMTSPVTQAQKVRICYFTNWAQYRGGLGNFSPQNVDASLCTHLLYAFAYVDLPNESLKTVEWNDAQFYQDIVAKKDSNPDLKVLLAVGGATHGTGAFEALARDERKLVRFVGNAIRFLRQHGFDGLDVDWEFPNKNTKGLFQRLIQRLGEGFRSESVPSGRSRLQLTVAVAGNPSHALTSYGPSQFVSDVDYILLMAYDLWGSWSKTLGHQSPLYVMIPGHYEQGRFSMNKLVEAWEAQGAPKDKLVLGMATYGRTGILSSASRHNPGDPWTTNPGSPGAYTGAAGILAYYEICDKMQGANWNTEFSEQGKVPYAWNSASRDYICYDNPRSFEAKANYILDKGLAGAMFWTLDFDDFSGQGCHRGKYPLIAKVKAVLENTTDSDTSDDGEREERTTTTLAPRTATVPTTTTTPMLDGSLPACKPFRCTEDFGFSPDPADCSQFYQCVYGRPKRKACPPGLLYDTRVLVCNWPSLVTCKATCSEAAPTK